mgnify:CR=1 FL=1
MQSLELTCFWGRPVESWAKKAERAVIETFEAQGLTKGFLSFSPASYYQNIAQVTLSDQSNTNGKGHCGPGLIEWHSTRRRARQAALKPSVYQSVHWGRTITWTARKVETHVRRPNVRERLPCTARLSKSERKRHASGSGMGKHGSGHF